MFRPLQFPAPYPDECYYSILCRYFVRSGCAAHRDGMLELLGKVENLAGSLFLPRWVDRLRDRFGDRLPVTPEELTLKHSCVPYFSLTYSERIFTALQQALRDEVVDGSTALFPAQQRRNPPKWHGSLRYCPACAAEDRKKYGEPYWRRLPQLPGVEICPRHGARICSSDITYNDIRCSFMPASYVLKDRASQIAALSGPRPKYEQLASDTEWLLENGLLLGGADNLARKYKNWLAECGYRQLQGRCARKRVTRDFLDYHGQKFIAEIFPTMEELEYWLGLSWTKVSWHVNPLVHILLMEFLGGSVENFFLASPQGAPLVDYGPGPWVCLNKVCPDYNLPSAELISCAPHKGGIRAEFRCPKCGMTYVRTDPRKSLEDYAKRPTILDYGELWNKRLRDCVEKEKLSVPEIAVRLECSQETVRKCASRLNIQLPLNARHTETSREKNRNELQKAWEDDPQFTISKFRKQHPGIYRWLNVYDFEWYMTWKQNSK